jgi:hypothetical protein
MNIYFTISIRGAREHGPEIKKMLEHLENSKHKVTRRSIKVMNHDDENNPDVKEIVNLRGEDVPEVYKSTLRKIREADVVIADTSVPSSSVGYEIAMAQAERKPILVLHSKNSLKFLADVLGGNTSKVFKLAKYGNAEEAIAEIDGFLKAARDMIDTKFILIISPEIDRYLEWVAEERRMHKAQVVRNAIEEMMAKDKDFKQYSKDSDIA